MLTTTEYIEKLRLVQEHEIEYTIECDCVLCRKMCQTPCCPTPEEVMMYIDVGYGDRMMMSEQYEVNDKEDIIKDEYFSIIQPAFKYYRRRCISLDKRMRISRDRGCTFWKKGLCEIHSMKPAQAKVTKSCDSYYCDTKRPHFTYYHYFLVLKDHLLQQFF